MCIYIHLYIICTFRLIVLFPSVTHEGFCIVNIRIVAWYLRTCILCNAPEEHFLQFAPCGSVHLFAVWWVWCSVCCLLQCVVVRCSMLQFAVCSVSLRLLNWNVWCSVMQSDTVCCRVFSKCQSIRVEGSSRDSINFSLSVLLILSFLLSLSLSHRFCSLY